MVSIVSGVVYVAMFFLLPETYITVLQQRKRRDAGISDDEAQQSFKDKYSTNLIRPWVMLFTEPILFTLGLYSAFVWGILCKSDKPDVYWSGPCNPITHVFHVKRLLILEIWFLPFVVRELSQLRRIDPH